MRLVCRRCADSVKEMEQRAKERGWREGKGGKKESLEGKVFFLKCCAKGHGRRSAELWYIYTRSSEFRGSASPEMKDAPQMHFFCPEVMGNFQRKYKETGRAKDEEVEERRDCSLVPAGTLQTHW